jgi:hypothetical protein
VRAKPSERLIEAMTVAMEITSTTLTDPAFKVMVFDLAAYPEDQVIAALRRCCRELKGRLTLADILTRIDDGRPGPEEAWALVPKDEFGSVVWTSEMRDASAAAQPHIAAGDLVAGRMAFLERYRLLVQQARDARLPVEWHFSPGMDKDGRELVLLDAAQKGRLSVGRVRELLPYHREDEGVEARLLAIEGLAPALPNPEVKQRLAELMSRFPALAAPKAQGKAA